MQQSISAIPLQLPPGTRLRLSSGKRNELVKCIVHEFCPRFTPGATPLYIGDTAKKWAYYEAKGFETLGVELTPNDRLPDLIIHHREKNWLVLIDAVTSRKTVDAVRRSELEFLFAASSARPVFVLAFTNRAAMAYCLEDIASGSDVWVAWAADEPSHLIEFNDTRLLGPYNS